MTRFWRLSSFALLLAYLLMVATPASAATNVIVNGGFEQPAVPAGSYQVFSTGSGFPGWTVTGVGNVGPVSGSYTSGDVSAPAYSGAQWLDLTGYFSNSATGVAQTVTTGGGSCTLNFWVGNIVDPDGIFGTTSTVVVLVNGSEIARATNSLGGKTLTWQSFTETVSVPQGATTIEFRNADPGNDNSNGLDDVELLCESATPPDVKLPPRFDPSVLAHFPPAAAARFRQIAARYYRNIPNGPTRVAYDAHDPLIRAWTVDTPGVPSSLGALNNILAAWGDRRANQHRCGDYQDKVLHFLNSLRFSDDPANRALVEGLDYGPLQAFKGFHRAVVIYPRGTDWRTTGVVLDPWTNQQPDVYGAADWQKDFKLAEPDTDAHSGRYPLTGAPDYIDPFIHPKPRPPSPAPARGVAVRSPVTVLLKDSRRGVVGLGPDRRWRATRRLRGDATALRTRDGYSTSLLLPNGRQTITMRAFARGSVHVYTASRAGGVRVYKTVKVRRGDRLVLSWPRGVSVPRLRAKGKPITNRRVKAGR